MTQVPTIDVIELMKSADLVKTYNEFAPMVGQKPVKKFETREIGIKRVTAVCDGVRHSAPVVEAEREKIVEARGAENPVPPSLGWSEVDTSVEDAPAKTKVEEPTAETSDPAEEAAAAFRSGKKAKEAIRATSPASTKSVSEKVVEVKEKKPTIAARVRALVQAGWDNAKIWAAIQPEFGIADKHRGMVSWYRNDMIRRQKREASRAV